MNLKYLGTRSKYFSFLTIEILRHLMLHVVLDHHHHFWINLLLEGWRGGRRREEWRKNFTQRYKPPRAISIADRYAALARVF